MWAILSGIEGNLAAYEAVLDDIQKNFVQVEQLYILGDLIGPNSSAELVVQRVRQLQKPQPQVCIGWWEEQCFNLYGLGGNSEAQELLRQYDGEAIKLLWDSVSRETVQWLRQQHFGFVELDCLLIHASSVSVSDELTPETPAWKILDRFQRADVNQLFCGRSGTVFEYVIQSGSISSTVSTLTGDHPPQAINLQEKRLIGVGSVGRFSGKATYTLYSPGSNQVQFQTVCY
ncbi:MAG: metallophosphoesterase family protein [Microcoleaceae cyanobacterium]